jgi:hypothetical protein
VEVYLFGLPREAFFLKVAGCMARGKRRSSP